ncbi:MAG TPA: flippase activity-associated protein Agl23 [Chloroflexota bacterium]|nr:flippase activity-associated protein Agl23 [Chloroflexota bacterium]
MVQVGPRAATSAATQTPDAPPAAPDQGFPPVEVESAEAPTQPETPAGPRWRRYSIDIPIDPEYLPFLGLMFVGLVLRFWDLGAKAFHHDESLHAFYSWRLFDGQGYVHDPMMHGPLLFELNAVIFLLFGASDFTARLAPALLGVGVIGLPFLLRHELGRNGAIAAAVLFTVSPAFLYFSRFIRHDIYVDFFTLLLVIGVFRYLATAERKWFYTACVAAALLFATKEDFFISGFIPFVFLVGAWFLLKGEHRRQFRSRVKALGGRPWAIGLGIFLAINLILYTTFLTNLQGICSAVVTLPVSACSGSTGALSYWLQQQDFARGGQPWFYYFLLLPLYEFVPLLLGLLAIALVRPRQLFFWFCAFWFVAALMIYSWAGEKMPWMLPQITLPLVLLAGRLLGQWADAGWGRRALTSRGLATGGLILLAMFALLAWVGLGAVPAPSPVAQQSVTLQRLALAVLIACIAGGLVYLGPRWGREIVVPGIALGGLSILAAGYIRTTLMVTYDHPDVPVEPLIYVQSTPDVPFIANEISRIAAQTGQGKDLKILLDNGWGDGDHEAVSWPFEWYLRDYKNRRYYTKTIDSTINLADYPVLLARSTNLDPIQAELAQYTCQTYKLNAWFPEDYKAFAGTDGPGFTIGSKRVELPTLKFDVIGQTLSNPDNRLRLLKFLLYRQAPGDTGAREMLFCVNKEIPALGPAPLAGVASSAPLGLAPAGQSAPLGPRNAVLQTQSDGSSVYGRDTDGRPVLVDPKNVAVAPDGRLYVVEGRAARVTVFNPDGSVASSWGSSGQGDGQFQEPWGIAVAPNGNVYVADTWNHRIQFFDPTGKFLGKWGKLGDAKGRTDADPSVFWGPRSIAISPDGDVYVTDTGNKRIQVFGLDGTFKRMFGGDGGAPGQFKEEVGVALDAQGNVWVADTWNGRIQKLSPDGQPLAQIAVSGWESQNVTNKPYLAVDAQGRVFASFPEQARVVEYGPDGQQLKEIPLQGSAPVGLVVAPDGRLLVADARGNIVDALPSP